MATHRPPTERLESEGPMGWRLADIAGPGAAGLGWALQSVAEVETGVHVVALWSPRHPQEPVPADWRRAISRALSQLADPIRARMPDPPGQPSAAPGVIAMPLTDDPAALRQSGSPSAAPRIFPPARIGRDRAAQAVIYG
jgi:hypothetical protein